MNIITGTGRAKGKGLKAKSRKAYWFMRSVMAIFIPIMMNSCTSKQPAQEQAVTPKSDVQISYPVILPANRLISYQGVTRYMQSNDIRTQINGIISRINCAVASEIHTNQPLFIIQPQEAAALKKLKFNNQILTGLSDTIFASLSGKISKLNVQVGDFVQVGDVLASCIRGNSMRIIVYIPVEQVSEIEKMRNCKVILPDGSILDGSISGQLPTADPNDQTQSYIIETKKAVPLSENINLKIQFSGAEIPDAIFVPESAIIGNEEQTRFWVMKMMNDSTCIKVPVEKGMKQDTLVQLIDAGLIITDRIISEGAYGLPDSARVQILNPENDLEKQKRETKQKSTGSRH